MLSDLIFMKLFQIWSPSLTLAPEPWKTGALSLTVRRLSCSPSLKLRWSPSSGLQLLSLMNLHISGLATLLQWNGGTIFGSMKVRKQGTVATRIFRDQRGCCGSQPLLQGPPELPEKNIIYHNLMVNRPCTVDYFEQFCAISKVPMVLIKESAN